MRHRWTVLLDTGDGRPIEGVLDVSDHHIAFRADARSDDLTVFVDRADIERVALVVEGISERVIVTTRDGRRFVLDHGVLPAADLARALTRLPQA